MAVNKTEGGFSGALSSTLNAEQAPPVAATPQPTNAIADGFGTEARSNLAAVVGASQVFPGQTTVPVNNARLQWSATGPSDPQNPRFASSATFDQIAAGSKVLGAGASGPDVTTIQTALLDMGFSTKQIDAQGNTVPGVSGTFDANTVTAVKNFQVHAAHFFAGIQPTGKLDAATMRALDALAPAPGNKSWSAGESPELPNPFWGGDHTKPLSVVVVKDEHRTYLFDKQGKIAGIFTDSVGKAASQTHDGLKVVIRKENQAQAEADGRRLWGDPHAFGVRKIDLQFADGRVSGEQLHGVSTSEARGQMGQDVSHGCARHYNDDIITMYNALNVGDRVAIVDSITDPHLSAPKVS